MFLMILNIDSKKNLCEILNCITKTALTYLCNLAGTDYELPEDDTIVSKCGSSKINCQLIVYLLVHCTK